MDKLIEARPARRPFFVIEATRGLGSLNLRELWAYRDLLWKGHGIGAAKSVYLRSWDGLKAVRLR